MGQSDVDARSRVLAVLELGLIALAIRCIAGVYAVLPIAAPFQADYEEGNILNALSRILAGETPWPDPRRLPSVINPYGPVAYYPLAVPARLFGLRLVYPRAMIVGCVLLIAALLGAELRRRTGSSLLAVTFSLIYLTIPNIQDWGWVLRVDFLGIAFTLAGVIVFSRRLDREEPPGVAPALLFAAGLLVKTTLVAAPAACFAVLLSRRRFGDAARLAGVTAAAVVLVVAAFAAITRGAIVTDVYLSHPDPYSKRMFVGGLLTMIWGSWPLVTLAAVAVLDDVSRARLSTPVAWLLTATAATFTAGALGSNRNHFLEWNTALCLAGGLGMARLARLRPRAVGIGLAAAAAAGLAVVAWIPREIALIREHSQCLQAYDWVRTRAGPDLLSENVGALVLGGKRVWVSNPFALAQMVEHAGWSDEELQRMVRERRFDAIIVRPSHMTGKYRRFTLGVLKAITENYEPRPGYDCLDMGAIYEPKR